MGQTMKTLFITIVDPSKKFFFKKNPLSAPSGSLRSQKCLVHPSGTAIFLGDISGKLQEPMGQGTS